MLANFEKDGHSFFHDTGCYSYGRVKDVKFIIFLEILFSAQVIGKRDPQQCGLKYIEENVVVRKEWNGPVIV